MTAPFDSTDLAALLSGGSSKEFESETTTGRFGTGFLVTHVLAEKVRLRGLLDVGPQLEEFELTLDRAGNEADILANIHSCKDAIRSAKRVEESDNVFSARFEYGIGADATFVHGLNALTQSLPYLFGTRPSLGDVEIDAGQGALFVWTGGPPVTENIEGGVVTRRWIRLELNGILQEEFTIYRFGIGGAAEAAALVLVVHADDDCAVRVPEANAPRLYREYPIRASGFVPVNLVLDGKFEPDQERNVLLMNANDKRLISNALDASALAVTYAFERGWRNCHWLARAGRPAATFESNDDAEARWWIEELRGFADRLSRLPIIECTTRFLPAVSDDCFADFIVPRLSSSATHDETTVARMWPLVEASQHLFPPRVELAQAWTEISEGWHQLGLDLGRITMSELAHYVRGEATCRSELQVSGDPLKWLADFLDIVGECWRARGGVEHAVLQGLLPNQNERLCSPGELWRDNGVPERLKQFGQEIGVDVRDRLLFRELRAIGESSGYEYLHSALEKSIRGDFGEGEVIEELLVRRPASRR